ncbi:MAG: hypothetical protein WBA12_00680 [Catalinimonas sp.]
MRRVLLLSLGALLTLHAVRAQDLAGGNMWDQDRDNFVFKVKQIDEFLERFNNEESTLLNEQFQRTNAGRTPSRRQMLSALFNQADDGWDPVNVQRFLAQVDNDDRPARLDFQDEDWYATADCNVLYAGEARKVQLTLKIEKQPDGRSLKWVIVGARGDFLLLPDQTDPTTSLTPYSHGTDFMNLGQALLDMDNVRNYLPNTFEASALTLFIYGVRTGQVKFTQVNRVRYHFLQVEDWVFTVEQFERSTQNSGWLISRLAPADNTGKNNYRRYVLHID